MSGIPPPAPIGRDRTALLVQVSADACKTAASQYDDYYRSFVGLDGKAQAAATVAGVLLGAFVAFINSTRLLDLLSSPRTSSLVWFCCVGSLATVMFSLLAMRVRNAPPQFIAEEQIDEALELAAVEDSSDMSERLLRYYQNQLVSAKWSLVEMHGHVTKKGQWLFLTQIALFITLLVTVLFILSLMYTAPTQTVY